MDNETLLDTTQTETENQTGTDSKTVDDNSQTENETTETKAPENQEEKTTQEGAPEKYEFAKPETGEYDEAVLTKFGEFAKEANLTNDQANKMLSGLAQTLGERQAEQLQAVRTDWANSSKSDKEFGGDRFNENLGLAKKALEKFGTPELTKFLNETGIGNHPEIIRVFVRAGKAISEDSFVGGGDKAVHQKSAVEMLYGTN